MIPIFAFCGASGSGKTTLLCQVINYLTNRGIRVGVVKHHGSSNIIQDDQLGKDSDRFLKAKAHRVIFAHTGGINLFDISKSAKLFPYESILRFFGDLDLVLVEGYKKSDLNKIEVVAPGRQPILPKGGRLLALARRLGKGIEFGLPVLNADNPSEVAVFILDRLKPFCFTKKDNSVIITINGLKVSIRPFIARLINQIVRTMLGKLNGTKNTKNGYIEVKLG